MNHTEKSILQEAEAAFLKMDPGQVEIILNNYLAVVRTDSDSYISYRDKGKSIFLGRKRASNGEEFAVFAIR